MTTALREGLRPLPVTETAPTVAAYRAWLETMPADKHIGVPCDANCCPIAMYEQSRAGFPDDITITVTDRDIYYQSGIISMRRKLSLQFAVFRALVDRAWFREDKDVLTVADCLRLLDEAEAVCSDPNAVFPV